ncbi:MAG: FAD-binding oxidoreductase [Phycisphaerales bacterium]|nr:FAD-binding oxidoreductase [Phycisphaerales bacterium]
MRNQQSSRTQLERELKAACTGEVWFDQTSRGVYATDASIYQVMPLGVVVPSSIDDAVNAVGVIGNTRMGILPRGGGTSLAGQCVNEAVVLDLSAHCTRLIECNPHDHWCRVESGITIDDLNDQIASTGLYFAPDPSTARQACIGGCIGNNAAGAHSILYGRTSENVLGIEVCLWNGSCVNFEQGVAVHDEKARSITNAVLDVVEKYAPLIRERFPKTMRRSAGYQLDEILSQIDEHGRDLSKINLAPLLCGSEGTLACTLQAKLKLIPLPKAKGLAILSFGSIEEAINAVEPILELHPSAVELLDKLILELARKNPVFAPYTDLLPRTVSGEFPEAVLYVEFYSQSDTAQIEDRLDQLKILFSKCPIRVCDDSRLLADAWALRKAGEPLLHAIAGTRKPLGFVEDNAVPVHNLSRFVAGFREIVESEGTTASYYAHASVGVLHVRPLLDLRDPQDEQRMIRIAQRVATLAQSLGGVPSGEHGDGRARGPLLEAYFGPQLMQAFREIKHIFDPHNLMNPGNITAPGPIESIARNTRIKPFDSPVSMPQITTHYSFDQQGGFGHAAEMCNGAGVCRKKNGGTMCPSYQATLDERHSTRGRGNALRLAITGQTPEVDGSAWNDPGAMEILDLCLSCKACKSECPSSVDISKLKAEYLAKSFAQRGRAPWRAQFFSKIHALNRIGSFAPGAANALNRFPPMRSVLNHALGIHPSRSLPIFAKPVRASSFPQLAMPKVLVLSDTFSTHNEPHIVGATRRVLERFGYSVAVLPVSDMGRAAISQGCLATAIRDIERMIDLIEPSLNDESIAGFVIPEPSCLSAICDDWLELKIDRSLEIRKAIASKAALPEVFLDVFWDQHPTTPGFTNPAGLIKVHGHCHQKALWGEQSAGTLLKRLFPDQTEILDTGCCGMAGAFGFAANKYDLSMQIGEQRLFPAVRSSSPEDIIVASGTSCRHQILDGTGARAIHAIELIDQLVMDEPG